MDNGKGFLETLAEEFYTRYSEESRHQTFVFPNRRSAVYFRHHLSRLTDSPLWSPRIFSITDFLSECSSLKIPETHEMIFRLYRIYRDIFPEREMRIEDFFQSGKIILSDLSEIDKNLADTESLFRSLEGLYGLEKDSLLRETERKKEYLAFWADVDRVYHPFREFLKRSGLGYEGMVFRSVAENPELLPAEEWPRVTFAGFNALSQSEKTIIIGLREAGRGELILEEDPYFTEDPFQEAGSFLRKNENNIQVDRTLLPPGGGLKGKKKIHIVQTTSGAAQVKYCGIRLKNIIDSGGSPDDIALVLPDQGLMFPILNSLPDGIGQGNISLGYPLKQTSIYLLYEYLMELHTRPDDRIYREDLIRLLEHPYIRLLSDREAEVLLAGQKERTDTFIPWPRYSPSSIPELLITPVTDSLSLMERMLHIINRIRELESKKGDIFSNIEKEFIYRFSTLAEMLGSLIRETGEPVSLTGFRKMFNDLVGTVHIPFSGEPLEGLQILGVLEMQNLRFQNLFILSMNEDTFPSGKYAPTYIPQDVRREYKLPVHGEREAVFAYHFYRMLANSEDITLLYSGVSPGQGAGERSRFIDQLLLEYAEYNPRAEITRTTADFQITVKSREAIEIPKNEYSLNRIRNRSYSPTALRDWLVCPLRFWFKYILRIRENEETDDASNPALFGSIAHKVLERIYKTAGEEEVGPGFFSSFSGNKIDSLIKSSFLDNNVNETETGLNRITFEVIRELTSRFITAEKESAPFRILALEKKLKDIPLSFNREGKEERVMLNGYIDRHDEKDGVHRIIDYKTGNIDSLNIKKTIEEIDFVKQKELFQLLVYALMLKKTGELPGRFRLGIYPFRDLTKTLQFVRVNKSELLSVEILDEFEEKLSEILADMFDPGIPFTQTEDEKNCRYCPHKIACQRALGDTDIV